MGLYDRDYMRDRPLPQGWPPADEGRDGGLLRDLGRLCLVAVGTTAAVFAVGWLVSGGHAPALPLPSETTTWLTLGAVAMPVALVVGADDPGGLRRGVALMAGVAAVFAFYAWVMGRMGFDVGASMLQHERGPGSGLPVFEGLVHATPWWLLCLSVVAGFLALGGSDEFEGFRWLGTATLLVSLPYLTAKVLTEVFGLHVFG